MWHVSPTNVVHDILRASSINEKWKVNELQISAVGDLWLPKDLVRAMLTAMSPGLERFANQHALVA